MEVDLQQINGLAIDVKTNPAPTGDEFLDKRWEENVPNKPYYRFFYHLTKQLKPNVVIELGGWQGTSAAHFAAGCPESKVATIDHHTDPGDDEHQKKMLEIVDRYPNLKYVQGWTVSKVAEEQAGEHALGDAPSAFPIIYESLKHIKATIDILFIDSWHVRKYAELDWQAYSPLLSNTALVIVDDCINGTPGTAIDGIRDFFDSLPGDKILIDGLNPGYPMGVVKYEKDKN